MDGLQWVFLVCLRVSIEQDANVEVGLKVFGVDLIMDRLVIILLLTSNAL